MSLSGARTGDDRQVKSYSRCPRCGGDRGFEFTRKVRAYAAWSGVPAEDPEREPDPRWVVCVECGERVRMDRARGRMLVPVGRRRATELGGGVMLGSKWSSLHKPEMVVEVVGPGKRGKVAFVVVGSRTGQQHSMKVASLVNEWRCIDNDVDNEEGGDDGE